MVSSVDTCFGPQACGCYDESHEQVTVSEPHVLSGVEFLVDIGPKFVELFLQLGR